MGWGEAHGRSPELMALRRQLAAGADLAAAVRAWLEGDRSTGQEDRLAAALSRFEATR